MASYVATRQPPQGVLIDAGNDRKILVWYDAVNKLHVIDVTDTPEANSTATQPYHTQDESFMYDLQDQAMKVAVQLGSTVTDLASTTLDVLERTAKKIPDLVPSGNLLVIGATIVGIALIMNKVK